jgi:hypothetical protein
MTDFKPVELKVNLYTNIPSGIDFENYILTFSTLSSEDLKDLKIKPTAYPFFSYQINYPETSLASLTYEDVVKTFFDKDEFIYKFGNSGDVLPIDEPITDEEKTAYYTKRRANINNNVMLMLRYLLPTKWPVVNNHFNSYDLFIGKDPMHTLMFNPFLSSKYVYLKLSSGTYTMKKIVWLNDFLNHPEYRKAFEPAGELKMNGNSSNNLLRDAIDSSKENLYEDIKKCYYSKCDNNTRNLANVGMQIIDNDSYEIVVDVELFENELKSGEESKIKCAYYGDYLGEELTRLIRQGKRRTKPPKGLIIKMPLFSTTNMTSRKQGDIDKDEVDKDKKEKRKREDAEYNDIERNLRKNYEDVILNFFKIANNGALKTRIKKNDINIKNFYNFMEENLPELFRYIISSNTEKVDKTTNSNIYTTIKNDVDNKISRKLDAASDDKNRKRISKEDYDRLKINFDLAKELSDYISSKSINSKTNLYFPGGTTKKRLHKIKRRYTRRHK